ncbi:hypothetical protein B566_EDAN007535 [Ephemera danica]|nr:hypothetical protein B566_EDAN007535 [Ephemera danica]
MCLRNLDMDAGMCNGTILTLIDCNLHVMQFVIAEGEHDGETVFFIPRMKMTSNDSFKFWRKQFPMKLASARTINKPQGKTMNRVGLHLTKAVFSHGQLFVSLSRTKSFDKIKVCIPTNRTAHGFINGKWVTHNIVNPGILAANPQPQPLPGEEAQPNRQPMNREEPMDIVE